MTTIANKLNNIIKKILDEDIDDDLYAQVRMDLDLDDEMCYMNLAENLTEIHEDFVCEFFDELGTEMIDEHSIDQNFGMLIRDLNSLWRLYYFLFKSAISLDLESAKDLPDDEERNALLNQQKTFAQIIEIIQKLSMSMLDKDPKKFRSFFKEFLLKNYIEMIKECQYFEKKIKYLELLYGFYGESTSAKKEALKELNDALNDQVLFIQSLSILVNLEKDSNDENRDLIEIFKLYSKAGLISRRVTIKISSLKIMSSLADLEYDWVQKAILRYLPWFSPDHWWEVRINYIIVMSKILENLVKSDVYKVLIKKEKDKIQNTLTPEDDKLLKEIKETFKLFSDTFERIVLNNYNEKITKIGLTYFASLLIENDDIARVYVKILLNCNQRTRDWALYSSIEDENDILQEKYFLFNSSSMKYRDKIDSDVLVQGRSEILTELSIFVKDVNEADLDEGFVDLLIFCLKDADYRELNIEVFDTLINNSLNFFLHLMQDEQLMERASFILSKYIELYFKGEVLIQEFEGIIGDLIIDILNNSQDNIKANLREFLEDFARVYNETNPLFEQFDKFIKRLMTKVGHRLNNEDGEWMKELFGEDQLGGRIEERMNEEDDEYEDE